VHRGRPVSSNFLRDILHRMQTPAMKSNLCPPACRSNAITFFSSRDYEQQERPWKPGGFNARAE
jgi:hypothetical protein